MKSPYTLPAQADLNEAISFAHTARQALVYAFRKVRGHHSLEVQAETAGKAVKNLLDALEARRQVGGV